MKYLILFICLIFTSTQAQQRWEKLNGPMGAVIASIYSIGDTLIVGTGYKSGLIFYSTDEGDIWKQANIKIPRRFSGIVDTDYGEIIAATLTGDLYKTNDMYNWEKIFSLSSADEFWSLGKDHNGFIYAGTDFGRIYVSTNYGRNWDISLNVTSGERVESFLLFSDSILYAGTHEKLYKKTPEFTQWEIVTINLVSQSFNPLIDNENVLYAYSIQYILQSTDQGMTWIQLDSSNFLFNNFVYASIFNNRIISALADVAFVGLQGYGVAISDDKGWTWRYSNNGLPPRFSGSVRLAKSGNNTYLGTNAAGVFKSTDFGDSWFPVNNGITAATTLDLCFDNEGTMYSANWSNGFQKSTDNGKSWTVINNGLNDVYCMSIIADDNGVLLGGTENAIYRSTNKGLSWSTNSAGNLFAFHFEKDKQNRLYALTYGSGLYRSSNSGISWEKIDHGWFVSGHVFGFTVDSSGSLYAGTRRGAIYKSTNDGQSWTRSYYSSNPNSVISRITIAPNGYIYAANINEGVLRSTDNGANWQILNNGFTSLKVKELGSNSMDELYASTYDKLYKSTDLGESWTDITGKMYMTGINEIYITEKDDMYFATYESIWRNSPDSTTAVNDKEINISEYQLHQNYPNPFNPSTKISYTLKDEGNVKLLIYDIKGELISTLVNERQQSGNYEVDFTLPGNISTGVYIYRLTVTDNSSRQVFADVKKMVYLK